MYNKRKLQRKKKTILIGRKKPIGLKKRIDKQPTKQQVKGLIYNKKYKKYDYEL